MAKNATSEWSGNKGKSKYNFLPVSSFLQVDPSDKTTISSNSTKDWKPALNSVAHRGHFNQIKEETEKTIEESGIEFRPKRLILKQSTCGAIEDTIKT